MIKSEDSTTRNSIQNINTNANTNNDATGESNTSERTQAQS